jgi:hypothetical protein
LAVLNRTDAHLTGVILRLNDDGTTPTDNPFFNASTGLSGEAAANVKKIYAYGVRNSFGMAVDPLQEISGLRKTAMMRFDEINRVRPGANGGWIQTMGPINRVAEFKAIESTYGNGTLQQVRWSRPISPIHHRRRLRGSTCCPGHSMWIRNSAGSLPWRRRRSVSYEERALGPQFEGDLLTGGSRVTLSNGFLFRFKLSADRQHFTFTDSRLADLVADNVDKFDITESESLLIGRDFGITTDIQTAPNGNVYVVSLY